MLKSLRIRTERVLSTREHLITWDNGVIRFFNSKNFEETNRIALAAQASGKSDLSFIRIANGGFFIGFFRGNQLFLYELIEKVQPTSGIDFTNMRYLM